jgi:hypothetical protein
MGVGTRQCRVLTVSNINSDATGVDIISKEIWSKGKETSSATGAGLFIFLIVGKVVCKTRPYENNIRIKSQLSMPVRLNLPGERGGFIYLFDCGQGCL